MLGPQHGGRHHHPVLRGGRPLRKRPGHGPGPGPVPVDRGHERTLGRVRRHQLLEVPRGQVEIRPGPVLPEVPQVSADRIRLAVDELGRQVQLVELLVPELALRLRAEDAVTDTGQRGRDHQGPDQVGPGRGESLGDAAADVVAGDHRPFEPQFLDERRHAAGLRVRAVLARRISLMLVRFPEPAQVGRDHLGRGRYQRRDLLVVGAVPRPAVQQHGRRAAAGPVVGEAESVNRGDLAHVASIPPREKPFQGPAPTAIMLGGRPRLTRFPGTPLSCGS